ncbi:MAG: hypothetical protein D6696_21510 [Acidobacteria bacterium]|nr:MAG: hypothetical protein D6696_21510 [Acidobacteriota bacterium]
MAVYEHSYSRYPGPFTPAWSRFLVLPRFAFKDVFKSRLLVFFYALSVLVPVFYGLAIYALNNLEVLDSLGNAGDELGRMLKVDETFFSVFLLVQSGFAFWLTVFIGPGLISRDLANNGLPLYLSRPISRAEYVLGKLAVLLLLLSGITWVAGLLLFLLQSSMAGWEWLAANLHVAAAIVVTSTLWILVLSLLALALSAWLRWKVVAGLLFVMIFFVGDLFALLVNMLFRTEWGHVFNFDQLIQIVAASMLGIRPPDGPPVWGCVLALLLFLGFCLLLLHRKIRAYQVVS